MRETILTITILANILGIIGSIQSIIQSNNRIWPPPNRDSWQFWVIWTVLTIGQLGTIMVGIIYWNSIGFEHWSRFVTGMVFVLVGGFFLVWGMQTLSLHQSLGLKGKLVTTGPYAFTRNPQYLGYLLFYPGFMILTGSYEAAMACLLAMLIFLLAPFAEEPWLKEQYGEDYEEYLKNVQRFL